MLCKEPYRPSSAAKQQATKRTRSPSSTGSLHSRDLKSILNLASHESDRKRRAYNIAVNNNNNNRHQNKRVNRSVSVNYLYNKRQFDLRKFQKDFDQIYFKNHIGFTTEDIDDIYMPKKLNLFESKLKASMDVSDSSELEELKQRKEHLGELTNRQSNPRLNKRLKNETSYVPGSKLIISVNHNAPAARQSKSYLDEAKNRLEINRVSKAYYYNLNNKLKSSVTNVMKATQDLARTSELRQLKMLNRNSSLHELYDIRRHQIRSSHLKNGLANGNNLVSNMNLINSYTSDDIDSVYMPWMMENYGRKLAIEALKRRGNMSQNVHMAPSTSAIFQSRQRQMNLHKQQSFIKKRAKSPYVSQYYAQSSSTNRNNNQTGKYHLFNELNSKDFCCLINLNHGQNLKVNKPTGSKSILV